MHFLKQLACALVVLLAQLQHESRTQLVVLVFPHPLNSATSHSHTHTHHRSADNTTPIRSALSNMYAVSPHGLYGMRPKVTETLARRLYEDAARCREAEPWLNDPRNRWDNMFLVI